MVSEARLDALRNIYWKVVNFQDDINRQSIPLPAVTEACRIAKDAVSREYYQLTNKRGLQ